MTPFLFVLVCLCVAVATHLLFSPPKTSQLVGPVSLHPRRTCVVLILPHTVPSWRQAALHVAQTASSPHLLHVHVFVYVERMQDVDREVPAELRNVVSIYLSHKSKKGEIKPLEALRHVLTNEPFSLLIRHSTKLLPGWDDALMRAHAYGGETSVLTCCPASEMGPADPFGTFTVVDSSLCISGRPFAPDGDPAERPAWPALFWSCHLSFCRSSLLYDLRWQGSTLATGLQIWLRGGDFFAPSLRVAVCTAPLAACPLDADAAVLPGEGGREKNGESRSVRGYEKMASLRLSERASGWRAKLGMLSGGDPREAAAKYGSTLKMWDARSGVAAEAAE